MNDRLSDWYDVATHAVALFMASPSKSVPLRGWHGHCQLERRSWPSMRDDQREVAVPGSHYRGHTGDQSPLAVCLSAVGAQGNPSESEYSERQHRKNHQAPSRTTGAP
jgi:hypothetical protein